VLAVAGFAWSPAVSADEVDVAFVERRRHRIAQFAQH